MLKRYLVLLVLAIFATACDSLNLRPTATPVPFDKLDVQDVFTAFARAGLPIGGLEQNMLVSREGPSELRDRYVFEIPRIAPAGGQVIIFANPQQRADWEAYIETLRGSSDTRRDVIYTFFHANVMLQLNTSLTNDEANGYRDALLSLQ